jgi:putative transposase
VRASPSAGSGSPEDLVRVLGADSGISKSEVSRICADLDSEVAAFRDRSLAGQTFLYVFVDATSCKARVNRRVVSQAVVVATGVCGDGRREVLGFAVGDSEDGAYWVPTELEGPWAGRGAAGHRRRPPRPAPSRPGHHGRRRDPALPGPLPQKRPGKGAQGLSGDGRRGDPHVFAQPDAAHVHEQLEVIAGMLGRQFPKLEVMLRDSAQELLALPRFRSATGRRSGRPTRSSG